MRSSAIVAFEMFLGERSLDLRKIARRTGGELSLEDVQQSAWLMACEIERRRGFPVDFAEYRDQEIVLGWLHNEYVAYADKSTRYALSLDTGSTDADGEARPLHPALARLLAEAPGAGPLELLEAAEQDRASLERLQQSYSEAAAYVWLLLRFQWNVEALAADLCVVVATLRLRMNRAVEVLQRQPSLFDGHDVIDPDFPPTRGRQYVAAVPVIWQGSQACWHF